MTETEVVMTNKNESRIIGMPNIVWEIQTTLTKGVVSKEFYLFRALWQFKFETEYCENRGAFKTVHAAVKMNLINAPINYIKIKFSLMCSWLNDSGEEVCKSAPKIFSSLSEIINSETVTVWSYDYSSFFQNMRNYNLYFFCRVHVHDIAQHSTELINELAPLITTRVNSLPTDLKSLLDTSTMTDVILKCGVKSIPAHKCILSCRSPVFKAMLQNDFKESRESVVDIIDVEPEVFQKLIDYVYTENLDVTGESVETICNLFKAAHKYDIESLMERCACFLKEHLEPHQASKLLHMCNLYEYDFLKAYVISYIAERKEILLSEDWQKFAKEHSNYAMEVFFYYVRNSK